MIFKFLRCFLFCLYLHELISSFFFSFISILICTVLGNFTYFPGEILACLLCMESHTPMDSWMAKAECSFGCFGGFFPPHLAVSIYQPSFPVTRYFFDAKTSIKITYSYTYIYKNCSKKIPMYLKKQEANLDNTFYLPKWQRKQYKNISENSWYKGPVWWQFSLKQQSQCTLGIF